MPKKKGSKKKSHSSKKKKSVTISQVAKEVVAAVKSQSHKPMSKNQKKKEKRRQAESHFNDGRPQGFKQLGVSGHGHMVNKAESHIILKRNFYVQDIVTTVPNQFSCVANLVSPANTILFPDIVPIVEQYETYVFKKLTFSFVPMVGTNSEVNNQPQVGQIMMSMDYDIADTASMIDTGNPFTKKYVLGKAGAVVDALCNPLDFDVIRHMKDNSHLTPITRRYIDPQLALPVGSLQTIEPAMKYLGYLFISVDGCPSAGVVGSLFCDVEVELRTPQSLPLGLTGVQHLRSTAGNRCVGPADQALNGFVNREGSRSWFTVSSSGGRLIPQYNGFFFITYRVQTAASNITAACAVTPTGSGINVWGPGWATNSSGGVTGGTSEVGNIGPPPYAESMATLFVQVDDYTLGGTVAFTPALGSGDSWGDCYVFPYQSQLLARKEVKYSRAEESLRGEIAELRRILASVTGTLTPFEKVEEGDQKEPVDLSASTTSLLSQLSERFGGKVIIQK